MEWSKRSQSVNCSIFKVFLKSVWSSLESEAYVCSCVEPCTIQISDNECHPCFFEKAVMRVSPLVNGKDNINANILILINGTRDWTRVLPVLGKHCTTELYSQTTFLLFGAKSHYIDQVGLEVAILFPQTPSPSNQDYGQAQPYETHVMSVIPFLLSTPSPETTLFHLKTWRMFLIAILRSPN